MARAPKAPEAARSRYLPVPAAVVSHHADPVLDALAQWRASGKVPPVLLLAGPSGIGKTSMAHHLAQTLLCERSGFSQSRGPVLEEDAGPDLFGGGLFGEAAPAPAEPAPSGATAGSPAPCGECPACQKALKGNWVDFTEIAADPEDGENATLKIDQFRNLRNTMGFGAFDGGYRITLIREAERMTMQAANSLLKLLEEPPPGWVIFLTATDPALLLPTLVSRCQTLRLRPLPRATVQALLEGSQAPRDRQATAAALAHGSWSQALRYCEDEVWEARKTLLRFLEEPAAELNPLVDWAAGDARAFALLLDQLEILVAELVRFGLEPTGAESGATDSRKRVQEFARRAEKACGGTAAARAFWFERGARIAEARLALRAPLNKKLVAQDLLMPWLKVA